MKILFDTNIILDVLLNRVPFVEQSSQLVSAVEEHKIDGYLSATTITTIDYLLSKSFNRKTARVQLQKLLTLFNIAEVNSTVINQSLSSDFKDFEDAIQYFSGQYNNVDGLVTRNIKDFKSAPSPIYSPDELLGILLTTNSNSN